MGKQGGKMVGFMFGNVNKSGRLDEEYLGLVEPCELPIDIVNFLLVFVSINQRHSQSHMHIRKSTHSTAVAWASHQLHMLRRVKTKSC